MSWVYETLRNRIAAGEWAVGSQLPRQPDLAAQLGVATMTLRQALAALAAEGVLVAKHGKGTFVQKSITLSILVVDDEAAVRALLRAILRPSGFNVVEASGPADALACLESDQSVALIFSDLAMPTTAIGIDFVRHVRRGWPSLPFIAITAFPEELGDLHGTPECPVLVISKPFLPTQVEEALGLALGARSLATAFRREPVGGGVGRVLQQPC